MKTWTWKEWTAFGLIAALVIEIVVLHFVQPIVSYALLEFACCGTGIIAFIAGYLFGKSRKEKQYLFSEVNTITQQAEYFLLCFFDGKIEIPYRLEVFFKI